MGCVKSGCEGVLKLKNSLGEYLAIGEQTSWSLSYSAEANTYRPIGAYYPHRATSNHDWSLSVDGLLDILDSGQLLIDVGECVDFELYPAGEDANEPKYSGTIYIESADTSGSPDDLLPFSASTTGASTLVAENVWLGDLKTYNITSIDDVAGLTVAGDFITISWSSVDGATGYLLRYHDGNNTDWASAISFVTIPVVSSPFISPLNLEGKTVLIKAVKGCKESDSSTSFFAQTEYDPSILFSNGERGDYWDFTDMATLFQDELGTVPVITAGDPIRSCRGVANGTLIHSSNGGIYNNGRWEHNGLNNSQLLLRTDQTIPQVPISTGVCVYDNLATEGDENLIGKPTGIFLDDIAVGRFDPIVILHESSFPGEACRARWRGGSYVIPTPNTAGDHTYMFNVQAGDENNAQDFFYDGVSEGVSLQGGNPSVSWDKITASVSALGSNKVSRKSLLVISRGLTPEEVTEMNILAASL